jgi:hypothetical protein
MALKKSELYFSLWSSCDELRGRRHPRYEPPLPVLVSRVAELEVKVSRHLERMGSAP